MEFDGEAEVLNETSDIKPNGVSWKPVLAGLVGIPFLLALTLSLWLGTPQERYAPEVVYHRLGIDPVAGGALRSLEYGGLLFVRFDFDETEAGLDGLSKSLTSFEVGHGLAGKPITLDLDRPWWKPSSSAQGTTWHRDRTTFWRDDSEPLVYYAVAVHDRP